MQNRNCIDHLLTWAVMCLVRWCLSLKFSPHTCSGVKFCYLPSMVYSLMQCNAQGSSFLFTFNVVQLDAMQCSGVKFFKNFLSKVYSLMQWKGTWQRSRSVFRFLSKLLPSRLLWWLRMWKTAISFKLSSSSSFKKDVCAVYSTKIGGHPEGESALGASVARWKAACWRQAKGWYILS